MENEMDTNTSPTPDLLDVETLGLLSPAVRNTTTQVITPEDFLLREKMLFLLTIYPKLTPTMLHVGIGPQVRPQTWRPVLEALIREKKIKKEYLSVTTPKGQYRTYTVLSLASPISIEEWEELFRTRGASSDIAEQIAAAAEGYRLD
jgi:hypothetical protein